jgi:uncharacterized membrane protein
MVNRFKQENIFLCIIILFGILHILNTPFGAGFDEDTHIARIWEISKGALLPNAYLSQGPFFPQIFYDISYRQQKNLDPVSFSKWSEQLKARIDWSNMIYHNTRATYFPLLYLPQAFILGFSNRLLDIPVAYSYYLMRLTYLLIYAFLIYFSIRIIPMGKSVMGILSTSPMAIIQATTIQPESINNGVCFLFVAWILYLSKAGDSKKVISKRDLILTLILIVAICAIKLNSLPVLLLVFLFPLKRFGVKKTKYFFFSMVLLSIIIISLGWNYLVFSNQNLLTRSVELNPMNQFMNIFHSPILVLKSIFSNIGTQIYNYFIGWIGISGYSYWRLPTLVYLLYAIILIISILSEEKGGILNLSARIIMISVFLIMSFFVFIIYYITSAPNNIITGIQGRYFIGATPLLFLSLIPFKPLIRIRKGLINATVLLIQIIFLAAFFLVYHVTCGSSFYTGGLCYQPIYKNFSPQTSLSKTISGNTNLQQTFISNCNNLTQIRVWINQKNDTMGGLFNLRLTDTLTNTVIVNQQVGSDGLPLNGWLYINFPPIKDSQKKTYLFESSANTTQDLGLIVFAYNNSNEYPNGKLSFENKAVEGNIIFQYGCVSGFNQNLSN